MSNRITIQRPDLTPEERAKRMEEIKLATARLIIATEKCKIRKERNA
jgi:hypothetical protein